MNILDKRALKNIHEATLEVLEKTGIKIEVRSLLASLEEKGCKIDYNNSIAKIPPKIINDVINQVKEEESWKKINFPLSVHEFHEKDNEGIVNIASTFGGGCDEFFDFDLGKSRIPNANDLVNMIQLGNFLDEIKTVGNPVVCKQDFEGKDIDPKIQTITGASLIAKNTFKPGTSEVWSAKELDYLIEIGKIVRNGMDNYRKNPCFYSSINVTSPLFLDKVEGEILLKLIENDLPCPILSSPMAGGTSSITLLGTVVQSNAELFGVFTAIKSYKEDTPVLGSIISGVLNMKDASLNYSGPEAIIQNFGLYELWKNYYGIYCGVGLHYCSDAKYPGIQSSVEKTMAIASSCFLGNAVYPVGILNSSKAFSPEQAILDLEIANEVFHFFQELKFSEADLSVDAIYRVGPRGSYLDNESTLRGFRNIWYPKIFDRSIRKGGKYDFKDRALIKANKFWKQILKENEPYKISKDKSEEIDLVAEKAKKELLES